MISRLWRLLVLLSSLGFVGAGFLWVRSHWVSDAVRWQSHIPAWVSDSDYLEHRVETLSPETWAYLPVPAWHVNAATSGGGLEIEVARQSYFGAMIMFPDNSGWHYEPAKAGGYPTPQFFWPGPNAWYSRRILGFQWGADLEKDSGVSKRFIVVPMVAVAGLFALSPGAELWRLGRRRQLRRRQQACRCPACGYDLRASKDRCPECGRPIESV
jgi:hypothetical protein